MYLQKENSDGKTADQFTFGLRDLLVEGDIFADPGKCYLGIFPNTNTDPNSQWYAGAVFLTRYYTVFDMSEYEANENIKHLRLGMGERAPANEIGAMHYDPESSAYAPKASDDVSTWTYTPNKYTETDNVFKAFIKKNTFLFILCCVILAFLVVTLICLCVYLKRKSNKNRMNHMFKDKMTYYGRQPKNTKVQEMDLSLSLDDSTAVDGGDGAGGAEYGDVYL